jgi:hypothetical protein
MPKDQQPKKPAKREPRKLFKFLKIGLRKLAADKSSEFPPPESLNTITDADLMD